MDASKSKNVIKVESSFGQKIFGGLPIIPKTIVNIRWLLKEFFCLDKFRIPKDCWVFREA